MLVDGVRASCLKFPCRSRESAIDDAKCPNYENPETPKSHHRGRLFLSPYSFHPTSNSKPRRLKYPAVGAFGNVGRSLLKVRSAEASPRAEAWAGNGVQL